MHVKIENSLKNMFFFLNCRIYLNRKKEKKLNLVSRLQT